MELKRKALDREEKEAREARDLQDMKEELKQAYLKIREQDMELRRTQSDLERYMKGALD